MEFLQVSATHFFSIRPFQITLDQSTYYEGSQKLIANQHQCFTNINVRDLDPQQNLMLFFFPLVTRFFSPSSSSSPPSFMKFRFTVTLLKPYHHLSYLPSCQLDSYL